MPDAATIFQSLADDGRPERWILAYVAGKEGTESVSLKQGASEQSARITVAASPQYADAASMARSGRVLLQMLVMAIVLGSALAVIFN